MHDVFDIRWSGRWQAVSAVSHKPSVCIGPCVWQTPCMGNLRQHDMGFIIGVGHANIGGEHSRPNRLSVTDSNSGCPRRNDPSFALVSQLFRVF